MPYMKRETLISTLISFQYHYTGRNDFEILIIEDVKNFVDVEAHGRLLKIVDMFKNILTIKIISDDLNCYNPSHRFNLGYKASRGEFILLTNPEVFHETNILKGLDDEFSKDSNNYIVCSCKAVQFDYPIFYCFQDAFKGRMIQWYQHTAYLNRLFHFCSAISRDNYKKIGGFDERYCKGIAYDDDCLVRRIQFNGIKIIPRDDLITGHIEHDRQYIENNKALWQINAALFHQQCCSKDFFEKFV
jgi:hypothetical protein